VSNEDRGTGTALDDKGAAVVVDDEQAAAKMIGIVNSKLRPPRTRVIFSAIVDIGQASRVPRSELQTKQ